MKKLLLFLLLIGCQFYASSQKLEKINSGEVIREAIEACGKEDYEKAVELYNKVPENDTNYAFAISEKAFSLFSLKKFEEVIEICKERIAKEDDEAYVFYDRYASALDELGKQSEALEVYDDGLKKYPKYHMLYFNKAITLQKMEREQEAVNNYKKAIEMAPHFSSSHLKLGLLALIEGKMTESILALCTFLILEPNSNRSNQALSLLNQFLGEKPDLSLKKDLAFSEQGDDFAEVELILQNRVSLQKSYKVKPKLTLPLNKQAHAMFEKIEYIPSDKGFFMQTYVKLLKGIFDEGYYEPFIYFLLQSSKSEKHQKLVASNEASIKKFFSFVRVLWTKEVLVTKADLGNGEKKYQTWYHSNKTIEAIGNMKDGIKNGQWEFYHPNGQISAKGEYNEAGEKIGSWIKYYSNGNTLETLNFKNEKLEGDCIDYYKNGNIKTKGTYDQGKLTGNFLDYYYNGDLYQEHKYDGGKLNGPAKVYNKVRGLEYDVNYKDGKLDGELVQYHTNGEIAAKSIFVEGKKTGEFRSYYRNGNKKIEATYKNGEYEGKWVKYHKNGNISEKGETVDGAATGDWVSYYDNGKPSETSSYDDNGFIKGVKNFYSIDGILHYELTFKGGDIIAYKHYNKKGEVLSEGKISMGKLKYDGYHPDGVKSAVGNFLKKDEQGEWTFYDEYGLLSSTDTYEKGVLNGESKSFYQSGQLEKTLSYEDGKAQGYFVEYYPDGEIQEEGYYKDNNLDGVWKTYARDGELLRETYYINGKRHGIQKYYGVNGKLDYTEKHVFGDYYETTYYDTMEQIKHTNGLTCGTGEIELYYEDRKNLKKKGACIAGNMHGEFTWYYPGNVISSTSKYDNGKREGEWVWYFEDSKINIKGKYEYGNQEGKWEYYHESTGKLRKVLNYKNDELEGDQTWYNSDGSVSGKRFYVNGERHGAAYSYDGKGQLQYVRNYEYGKLVSYTYNDKNGKLLDPIPLENGCGKVVAYFKNGKKSVDYTYKYSMLDGEGISYYSNGNIEVKTTYLDGDYHGEYSSFYYSGKKKAVYNYKYNMIEGKAFEYYENGKLSKEVEYLHDDEHGFLRKYNKDGSLKVEWLYHNGRILK